MAFPLVWSFVSSVRRLTHSAVIPGRGKAANPESITIGQGYGLMLPRLAPPKPENRGEHGLVPP